MCSRHVKNKTTVIKGAFIKQSLAFVAAIVLPLPLCLDWRMQHLIGSFLVEKPEAESQCWQRKLMTRFVILVWSLTVALGFVRPPSTKTAWLFWTCFIAHPSHLSHKLQNKMQYPAVCCWVTNKPPRHWAPLRVWLITVEGENPLCLYVIKTCWANSSTISRSDDEEERAQSRPHMPLSPDPYQAVQPATTSDIILPQELLLLFNYFF